MIKNFLGGARRFHSMSCVGCRASVISDLMRIYHNSI